MMTNMTMMMPLILESPEEPFDPATRFAARLVSLPNNTLLYLPTQYSYHPNTGSNNTDSTQYSTSPILYHPNTAPKQYSSISQYSSHPNTFPNNTLLFCTIPILPAKQYFNIPILVWCMYASNNTPKTLCALPKLLPNFKTQIFFCQSNTALNNPSKQYVLQYSLKPSVVNQRVCCNLFFDDDALSFSLLCLVLMGLPPSTTTH